MTHFSTSNGIRLLTRCYETFLYLKWNQVTYNMLCHIYLPQMESGYWQYVMTHFSTSNGIRLITICYATFLNLKWNQVTYNMLWQYFLLYFWPALLSIFLYPILGLLFVSHNSIVNYKMAKVMCCAQMKYLYLVCIVLNHLIFSGVLTLYALLVYCSLCEADNAEDNRINRWHFFTSYVGHHFVLICLFKKYTLSQKLSKSTLSQK